VTPARYDVTDVVLARRRTRPPTWLFVSGLVVGWLLDAALVWLLLRWGVGVIGVVAAGVLGYLLLPLPVVTLLRVGWLRTHDDRQDELQRQLADHVPAVRAWLDARLGEPAGLPPDLATTWLLSPEPRSAQEILVLAPGATTRIGGAGVSARHETADGRLLLRLTLLPDATVLSDGPEPPAPV
jgi:hypothetical protein